MNSNANSRSDWRRVDAMTDEDINRAVEIDPDNPPLTEVRSGRMRSASEVVPEIVDAYNRGVLRGCGPQIGADKGCNHHST